MDLEKYGIGREIDVKSIEGDKYYKAEVKTFNSASKGKSSGNLNLRGVVAIVIALKELGGVAHRNKVKEKAAKSGLFSESEQNALFHVDGSSKLDMHLQWAMTNLKLAGLLGSPERGVWGLTEQGQNINLDNFDVWDDEIMY